jgi:hypothetical protein
MKLRVCDVLVAEQWLDEIVVLELASEDRPSQHRVGGGSVRRYMREIPRGFVNWLVADRRSCKSNTWGYHRARGRQGTIGLGMASFDHRFEILELLDYSIEAAGESFGHLLKCLFGRVCQVYAFT